MGLIDRISDLKKEWNLFWSSLFKRGRQKTRKTTTTIKSEPLSHLSLRRKQLNLRLEEIIEETRSLIQQEQPVAIRTRLDRLHDEGQQISEQIDDLSRKMNRSRQNVAY